MAALTAPASDLNRRLPWLLVFRAAVATGLLLFALVGDLAGWPFTGASALLYGVVIGTYIVVFVLGILLRAGSSPIVISAAHLTTAVMAALMGVQATGGVQSSLSFLYLLVILDGAIIGGRRVALAVASGCAVMYGSQLVAQLYGFFDGAAVSHGAFGTAVVVHGVAFYLVALLAGYLGDLFKLEQRVASTARSHLRQTEELHQAVLASLPLGVAACDANGCVTTANEHIAHILGIPATDLVGSKLPEPLRAWLDAGQTRGEVEIRVGSEQRTLFVSRPNLATTHPVVVLDDRTELRSMERALEAKKRLETVAALAEALAHELRNPLAAISGSIELLLTEPVDPTSQQKLRDILSREIKRLDRLVADFLAYAQPPDTQPVGVDVVALATDLCNELRRDWYHVELRTQTPEHLEAQVDPGQFRQMLRHLLCNAKDVTAKGGVVSLSIVGHQDTLQLDVSDHGPGIKPEFREHLFEPFRSDKAGGIGLGLAVVHRIVDAHNGTIRVSSQSGSGTIVSVSVPRCRATLGSNPGNGVALSRGEHTGC